MGSLYFDVEELNIKHGIVYMIINYVYKYGYVYDMVLVVLYGIQQTVKMYLGQCDQTNKPLSQFKTRDDKFP